MKFSVYLILLISLFAGMFSHSYAQEQELDLSKEFIMQYGLCSDFLKSSTISDAFELSGSHCGILIHTDLTGIPIVFSDTNSHYFYNYEFQNIDSILENHYYKGEELKVQVHSVSVGEQVELESTQHIELWGNSYASYYRLNSIDLDLLEDTKLRDYKQIPKLCSAKAYTLDCEKEFYQDLTDQLESIFRDILPRSDELREKNIQVLLQEAEKTQLIQAKFAKLRSEYQDSEKISFLLELIDYKLHIYASILEGNLSEKQHELFLQEQSEEFSWSYVKLIGNNVSIFESANYIYFYYKNTLVNTIKKDLSHFSQAEIQILGLSLSDKQKLSEELISRYSATKTPSGVDNDYALILKDWYQGPTTILVNSDGNRYAIAGIPTEFKQVGSYAYFISKEASGKIFLIGRISKNKLVEELYRFDPYQYSYKSYKLTNSWLEVTLYSRSQDKNFIEFIALP